jgi:hypothetical protein
MASKHMLVQGWTKGVVVRFFRVSWGFTLINQLADEVLRGGSYMSLNKTPPLTKEKML